MLPIKDRTEAGRCLGEALKSYRDRDDVLVLGLPRGGVPVACEVAEALGAQVDILRVLSGRQLNGNIITLDCSFIVSQLLQSRRAERVAQRIARSRIRHEQRFIL